MQLAETFSSRLRPLLARYGLQLRQVAPGREIPGSYWGDSEAGLIAGSVYVRPDTPLHSALHETAHYICLPPSRRASLHTDAGGDDDEESAVCYLQICLAAALDSGLPSLVMADMDTWGYSFRLGSASRWYSSDAVDARDLLRQWGLIDRSDRPCYRLRSDEIPAHKRAKSSPRLAKSAY